MRPEDPAHPLGLRGVELLRRAGWSDGAAAQLVERSDPRARVEAIAWLEGLRTRTGKPREARVRGCGRVFPALFDDGRVRFVPRRCKDRGCPACMVLRSRSMGNALRERVEGMRLDGRRVAFCTLTQPKLPGREETAGEALARCKEQWRRASSSRLAAGRAFRDLALGCFRSIEIVWAPSMPAGWHAHVHALVSVSESEGPGALGEACLRLWRAWLAATPGASSKAWHADRCDDRRVGQLAKYLTKPFELTPALARHVFEATASAHLVWGLGEFKGWRHDEPEHDAPGLVGWAKESIATFGAKLAEYDDRGRGCEREARVLFQRRGPGGRMETVGNLPNALVLSELEAQGAAASRDAERREAGPLRVDG